MDGVKTVPSVTVQSVSEYAQTSPLADPATTSTLKVKSTFAASSTLMHEETFMPVGLSPIPETCADGAPGDPCEKSASIVPADSGWLAQPVIS
ncbi:MAG: hypothetical protein ACREPX_05745 [Rhodanobacteraceae bacterium]